jgi:tetratricopeptide (TPR) repeat protein
MLIKIMKWMTALFVTAGFGVAQAGSPAKQDCALARQALQNHDLWKARAASQECLKLEPADAGARALAGEIDSQIGLELASNGRFADAAEHFRSVTMLQPDFPGGHYNLGLTLMNLSDAAGAEKCFRRVLQLSPSQAKARTQLANAVLMQARTNRTRMAEAATEFRGAIKMSPNDAELHFNLAYALGALSDDNGALAQYREVLRLDPRYPDGQASIGYTLYRLSEWAEAEEHFRAALAQGQDDYALHYYLGSVLISLGRTAEAQVQLERAIRLDAEQPAAHFQLASVYRAAKDQQRAAAELKLFRQLFTATEIKWREDALQHAAKDALHQGDLAQGVVALTRAFENRPDAVTACNLALAELTQGHVPQARAWLDKAQSLSPNDPAVYNYLGLMEAREGNLALAEQHFDMAVRLNPASDEAAYNAGVAALELGHTDSAIRYLEQAVKRSDESRVHQALAAALSAAGRDTEARRQLDAAQKQR